MTTADKDAVTTLATAVFWLSRLAGAFLAVAAVLIAGYAPYTADMWAILRIAGLLLLAAAACWLIGALAHRLLRPRA